MLKLNRKTVLYSLFVGVSNKMINNGSGLPKMSITHGNKDINHRGVSIVFTTPFICPKYKKGIVVFRLNVDNSKLFVNDSLFFTFKEQIITVLKNDKIYVRESRLTPYKCIAGIVVVPYSHKVRCGFFVLALRDFNGKILYIL